ncbi:MAG: ankyrin repeat domain-containing protein [Cyanobacteriota bacterium]|nr:ankyrin repeat domain-containing protein [Cyanobacteriota bacterium]
MIPIQEKRLPAMDVKYYYELADGDLGEALILGIQFRDWEAFIALLSVQNDINYIDKNVLGWTPLIFAAHEGSMEMVKILVENGADVNYRGIDPEEFALSMAAYGSYEEIFNYLEPLTSPELQTIARYILKRTLEHWR